MTYLLDTNLLIALAWPNHEGHQPLRAWLGDKRRIATCPITQTGFVRICSTPHAHKVHIGTPVEARATLRNNIALWAHEFWPDDFNLLSEPIDLHRVDGHNQVTDCYLVALARKHGGKLATLDRAAFLLHKPFAELIS